MSTCTNTENAAQRDFTIKIKTIQVFFCPLVYFLRSKVSKTVGFFKQRSDSLPFLAQFPPTLLQKTVTSPVFTKWKRTKN